MTTGASGLVFTLLGKPDCHLCHVMRDVVRPVIEERGARLLEKDVRDDPETDRRYRLEIPVLLLGEREIARHRVSAAELRERLAALVIDPPSLSLPHIRGEGSSAE